MKNSKFLKGLMLIVKMIFGIIVLAIFALIFIQRVSKDSVSLFGYKMYTVVTESMVPEYNLYEMLIVKEIDASDIKINDDVTYRGAISDFKGKIVTHRVRQIKPQADGSYRFVTKGIANEYLDPEISETQILGKVVYKSKILSFLSKIINNVFGFYFAIILPMTILIFIEVVETINEKKEEKDENEKEI